MLHTRSKGCGIQASMVSLCCVLKHWSLLSTGSSLGRLAQSVMCLATDTCLTADPGVASCSRFMEIDHILLFSKVILLPSSGTFKKSVTSKRMCKKYWLNTCSSLPRKKFG